MGGSRTCYQTLFLEGEFVCLAAWVASQKIVGWCQSFSPAKSPTCAEPSGSAPPPESSESSESEKAGRAAARRQLPGERSGA